MAYSNDHYIKILYKDFNILGYDIPILIKVYRYDIYKIGIVAHSKKINLVGAIIVIILLKMIQWLWV